MLLIKINILLYLIVFMKNSKTQKTSVNPKNNTNPKHPTIYSGFVWFFPTMIIYIYILYCIITLLIIITFTICNI